jgi:hypothetical protein
MEIPGIIKSDDTRVHGLKVQQTKVQTRAKTKLISEGRIRNKKNKIGNNAGNYCAGTRKPRQKSFVNKLKSNRAIKQQ